MIEESVKFITDTLLKSGGIYRRSAVRSYKVVKMDKEDLISRFNLEHGHHKDITNLHRHIINNIVKGNATKRPTDLPKLIVRN